MIVGDIKLEFKDWEGDIPNKYLLSNLNTKETGILQNVIINGIKRLNKQLRKGFKKMGNKNKLLKGEEVLLSKGNPINDIFVKIDNEYKTLDLIQYSEIKQENHLVFMSSEEVLNLKNLLNSFSNIEIENLFTKDFN